MPWEQVGALFFPLIHTDTLYWLVVSWAVNTTHLGSKGRESCRGSACLPEPQGGSQAGAVLYIEEIDRYG